MKKFAKFWLYIFVIFGLIFSFKTIIYNTLVKYKIEKIRENYCSESSGLDKFLENETENFQPKSIDEIALKANEITSKHLIFSLKSRNNCPDQLLENPKANCVGYTNFYRDVCNFLLKKYGFKDWECSSTVAEIYVLGINVHQYFSAPSFKNHDVNLIKNKKSGAEIGVDSSIFDYFGVRTIIFKN